MTEEENIYKNRWIILVVVVLLIFMATLDASIVNVALPTIAKDLSISMSDTAWIVTSYLGVIIVFILIFGRLGDIYGKPKIFKIGLIVFAIGSLMCGLSTSLLTLVGARIIQGIGAAAAMATNQGIITQAFPQGERGRALGIVGTFVALGTMAGPPIGGLIISVFYWNVIFLINVPIGIIVTILAFRFIPKMHISINQPIKFDKRGAFLFSFSLALLFTSINFGQSVGFNNPYILASIITSILLLIIFICIEKNIKNPFLDLNIFKNSVFSISIFCAFISFVSISSTTFILPFYYQDVLGLSQRSTGFYMMIYPIILSISAPFSGNLSDKIGSEILTFIGLLISSVGLFLLSTLNQNSSLTIVAIFIAIVALGNGLFQSPNTSLIMSSVDRRFLGVAGSLNALTRNIGLVFGILLSTTILYRRMSNMMGYKVLGFVDGRDDVFVYGMSGVYVCVSLICLFGACITAYRLWYSLKNKH